MVTFLKIIFPSFVLKNLNWQYKKGNFTLESSCVPHILYGIIDDKFVNFLF